MFFHRKHGIKVKICGIQDKYTAKRAVLAGADALGFIFVPESKRFIDPYRAQKIISELPRYIDIVGVFVNAPLDTISWITNQCNLNIIQLHGEENSNDLCGLGLPVIKCIKVKNSRDLEQINSVKADAILLDTYDPQMAGGTGRTFDWAAAQNLKSDLPFILAGGLTPDNVARAIRLVKPCAVDVSSGVETGGVKDIEKIAAFIKKAKEVLI